MSLNFVFKSKFIYNISEPYFIPLIFMNELSFHESVAIYYLIDFFNSQHGRIGVLAHSVFIALNSSLIAPCSLFVTLHS